MSGYAPAMGLHNRADHPVALKDAERLPKVGDLEVDVHDRFQKREWRVQRLGWTLMVLFLVASALGYLGGYGPLNKRTLKTTGLTVRTQRVVRHGGDVGLAIDVSPAGVGDDDTFDIWVDREWWQGMSTRSDPIPEPDSMRAEGDVVVFTFSANPTAGTQRVQFWLMPDAMGNRSARVGLVGGPSVSFRQLVLP